MLRSHLLGFLFSGLMLLFNVSGEAKEEPKKVVVNVNIADVRSQPLIEGVDPSTSFLKTQVLYSEPLKVTEERSGWYKVEIIQQQDYDKKRGWHPHTGWIRGDQTLWVSAFPTPTLVVQKPWSKIFTGIGKTSDDSLVVSVCAGTHLVGEAETLGWWKVRLPTGNSGFIMGSNVQTLVSLNDMFPNDLRKALIDIAMSFEGTPYLIGGRSNYSSLPSDHQAMGVDAGSFVHLVYRAGGIELPRTAANIYRKSKHIDQNPQKADLVFFANADEADTMIHVMLVVENDKLIEASGVTQNVRVVSATERLGKPLDQIRSGDLFGNLVIFLGSYLPSSRL